MELNEDEQLLYDFFVTFGQPVKSIDYPLAVLSIWESGDEDPGIIYPKKDEVVKAYCKPSVMDKPLYEAIKTIKGWK